LAVEPIGPVPAAIKVSPVRVRMMVLPPFLMSVSTAVVTVPVRAAEEDAAVVKLNAVGYAPQVLLPNGSIARTLQ